MNRFKIASLAATALVGLSLSGAASAIVWNEAPPGAGETIGTAQVTVGTRFSPLTNIRGMLDTLALVNQDPRSEVDVFRISITDFSSFSARTVSSNPDDTALFLFDSAGNGVYTNDDNGTDLLSTLPPGGPSANGLYYIAVALGGFSAWDAMGDNLFLSGSFTDVLGPSGAGPLASWSTSFPTLSEAGLAYDIELTGAVAAIPEPTTALLMLLGLGGIVAARSVRRQPGA